ncbi:MAG: LD-carboxypeptidase [Myxococcaceae bacterium]|nr:LD-carboxypeptidase [Myxococcaceae bacterium]
MRWLKPQPLRPGDCLRVVAPAGPFDRAGFDAGVARLSSRYRVLFDDRLFARERYLAGTDALRAAMLSEALEDREGRAVFCARGGYGAMRLLPSVRLPVGAPPLLAGFSDITALHALFQTHGRASLHAPVLTQLGRQGDDVLSRLVQLLESPEPAPPLEGTTCLVSGRAEGRLVGGNLSVFTRLLGTPYFPDVTGALLLLEDVGERPYRLDRMWTHLKLAGVFDRAAGIVLGDFTLCDEKDADYTHLDVLRALAEETGLPCAAGFRVGHGDVNQPVPLGVRARLDADAAQLTFLESLVEG